MFLSVKHVINWYKGVSHSFYSEVDTWILSIDSASAYSTTRDLKMSGISAWALWSAVSLCPRGLRGLPSTYVTRKYYWGLGGFSRRVLIPPEDTEGQSLPCVLVIRFCTGKVGAMAL